ncbi:MAG: hypothetical protein J6Y37_15210 [Paludibacteraceae bacterium]|nr:hypothetical protein [Paludibacteraceae bacterium]
MLVYVIEDLPRFIAIVLAIYAVGFVVSFPLSYYLMRKSQNATVNVHGIEVGLPECRKMSNRKMLRLSLGFSFLSWLFVVICFAHFVGGLFKD